MIEVVNSRPSRLLAGVAAFACGAMGVAVAQDRPLKESEVTQRALVEALAPRAPDTLSGTSGAASGELSRGFKLAAPQPARRQSILITFNTDSAELLPRTKTMLNEVAKALQSDKLANLSMAIEGHADPRGDEEHNLRLSQARAESVVAYLVSQHNIAPERLRAVGKGSAELLNRNEPTAAENRRVSIVTQPQ
jgi:outer membrane protein OmpA-like peptidoglycan-associated protein